MREEERKLEAWTWGLRLRNGCSSSPRHPSWPPQKVRSRETVLLALSLGFPLLSRWCALLSRDRPARRAGEPQQAARIVDGKRISVYITMTYLGRMRAMKEQKKEGTSYYAPQTAAEMVAKG